MLLTLPAAIALAVTSGPIVAALFQGGRFTAEDAATTGLVLSIIVAGLPAYVLIKVLTPGFYARKDMKTPVYIAFAMLGLGVALNFALIPYLGIAALAADHRRLGLAQRARALRHPPRPRPFPDRGLARRAASSSNCSPRR